MTRFDEVARLRELEKKATPKDWYMGETDEGDCDEINGRIQGWCTGVTVYDRDLGVFHPIPDGELGEYDLQSVCNPDSGDDAALIADLRNAAPWLLEVAGCFQPGYAALLKEIIWAMDTYFQDSHYRPHKIAMGELVKAAEIMEGME